MVVRKASLGYRKLERLTVGNSRPATTTKRRNGERNTSNLAN